MENAVPLIVVAVFVIFVGFLFTNRRRTEVFYAHAGENQGWVTLPRETLEAEKAAGRFSDLEVPYTAYEGETEGIAWRADVIAVALVGGTLGGVSVRAFTSDVTYWYARNIQLTPGAVWVASILNDYKKSLVRAPAAGAMAVSLIKNSVQFQEQDLE